METHEAVHEEVLGIYWLLFDIAVYRNYVDIIDC
jgi:hypothetical protein